MLRLFDRAHYAARPGAQKITHKKSTAVAYLWPTTVGSGFAYGLAVFSGKREKANAHLVFRTEKERWTRLNNEFERVQAIEAHKMMQAAKEKAERKARGRGLNVGDVLVSSWGYEQTNVDFYLVTGLVGTTQVDLVEIGAKRTTDDWQGPMSDHVVADPSFVKSREPLRRRAVDGAVKIDTYKRAHKWDGAPKYRSWYA